MCDPEQTQKLLDDLEREMRTIRKQIVDILWYMRGGLTRDDAWSMSYVERHDCMALIEERIKFVEKTNMPIL